jgi:hypothetical protein
VESETCRLFRYKFFKQHSETSRLTETLVIHMLLLHLHDLRK